MVCIDSDVLIDFMNNKKDAVEKMLKLRKQDVSLSTTSINSFELLNGANIVKIDSIKNFISNFSVHSFDLKSSEIASKIFQNLKSSGEIIEIPDIMIASICISKGESLLTRNLSHFGRIPELKIEKI
jgi:predicted nucleic acid-binding protein